MKITALFFLTAFPLFAGAEVLSLTQGVYLLVRYDPVKDEYAVLLENMTDRPLPVNLHTPQACRIVGSLRPFVSPGAGSK